MPPERPADGLAGVQVLRAGDGRDEVTDTARRLSESILHSSLPWIAPLACPGEVPHRGHAPSALRQQYGFSWRMSDRIALDAGTAVASRVLPLVPRPVRHAPKSFPTA